MSLRRRAVLSVATGLVGVVLAVGAAEMLARLAGYGTWVTLPGHPNEPIVHEPDALLGWRPKPGWHVFPGYTKGARVISMTFWPDHSRATWFSRAPRPVRVLLVGDSFTQGWAVTNKDTFAWKLQQRFPDVEVVNHGVAGYGTYQSLLGMKLALKRTEQRPAVVLYGFSPAHEQRNVADFSWLYLLSIGAHHNSAPLPYCSLGPDGRLVRHPPARYPVWPLRGTSVAVNVAQLAWAKYVTAGRTAMGRPVTEALLARMNRLASAHGVEFHVVLLDRGARRQYTSFLEMRRIPFIDCVVFPSIVPGEGHPNGAMHTRWADCLANALGPRFERAVAGSGGR